jgi:hypothetical protein
MHAPDIPRDVRGSHGTLSRRSRHATPYSHGTPRSHATLGFEGSASSRLSRSVGGAGPGAHADALLTVSPIIPTVVDTTVKGRHMARDTLLTRWTFRQHRTTRDTRVQGSIDNTPTERERPATEVLRGKGYAPYRAEKPTHAGLSASYGTLARRGRCMGHGTRRATVRPLRRHGRDALAVVSPMHAGSLSEPSDGPRPRRAYQGLTHPEAGVCALSVKRRYSGSLARHPRETRYVGPSGGIEGPMLERSTRHAQTPGIGRETRSRGGIGAKPGTEVRAGLDTPRTDRTYDICNSRGVSGGIIAYGVGVVLSEGSARPMGPHRETPTYSSLKVQPRSLAEGSARGDVA